MLGADNPLTALMVDLTGVDPDDAFSVVPYEKGAAFLWYLEDTVGGASEIFIGINYCLSMMFEFLIFRQV